MIIIRKFPGFLLTTLFIGILLALLSAITSGTNFIAGIGLISSGAFPFVLVIGLPVSFLSDCLTKKRNGKPRYIVALLIHSIFGLIAGFVISYFLFEKSLLIVGISTIAALIFWLVDEILRKKIY